MWFCARVREHYHDAQELLRAALEPNHLPTPPRSQRSVTPKSVKAKRASDSCPYSARDRSPGRPSYYVGRVVCSSRLRDRWSGAESIPAEVRLLPFRDKTRDRSRTTTHGHWHNYSGLQCASRGSQAMAVRQELRRKSTYATCRIRRSRLRSDNCARFHDLRHAAATYA
jgi:hypothetical protein